MEVQFPGGPQAPSSSPDALAPVRGILGGLLVVCGGLVLVWALLLVYGYLEGTSEPGLEARVAAMAREAAASEGVGDEVGAALAVAAPLVTLFALSLIASIGMRMVTAGASLLQPDWTQILRRFEQSIAALRQRP